MGSGHQASLLKCHSQVGQKEEGTLSLHLLPIECFLSPESIGLSPGSQNQEHLGEEAAEQGRGEREVVLQFRKTFGQQGVSRGSCPWLSLILPSASK